MKKKHFLIPDWSRQPPAEGSYRSIFKWGAAHRSKHPSAGFLGLIKDKLGLSDDDLGQKIAYGDIVVEDNRPSGLSPEDLREFEKIVGPKNIFLDTYSRLKYATGKAMEDIMRLRAGRVDHLPDVAVHPRHKADVAAIVAHCHQRKIPVHVYGGGSSVTLGLQCRHGGVTLVMGTHMNRLIAFNPTNHTITVEPGMPGPVYEDLLNHAPEKLGAGHRYTGGHFPQSFEHTSVGGWIVTLGAGQSSSYYGDAGDLVISQEYVTPAGTFKTHDYPATATGPKVNDIMKGSEGCFGVLVAVTLKVFRFFPQNSRTFAYMFPRWTAAVRSAREISQGEFGMPSILRISDAEETDVAMQMYGLQGSILDRCMRIRHLEPGKRCLLMGQADGQKHLAVTIKRNIHRVCRQHRGLYLTGYPMRKWRRGRFSDPYLRDALNDFGILIDTLETSVTWEHLHDLHQTVRARIKKHPHTICMTHASHFYPQGTNLYFIFITRMPSLKAFKQFQTEIIQTIVAHRGSLSHHHGIGRMLAPWMEQHLGKTQMDILRAIKNHLDPNGIMNPDGVLGLD